jgi:hypothetical protein
MPIHTLLVRQLTGLVPTDVDGEREYGRWFEPEPTRREFERILKPGGWVVYGRLGNGELR